MFFLSQFGIERTIQWFDKSEINTINIYITTLTDIKNKQMTVTDLKKYKDNLYSSLSRDLSEFEKNFLLISGGILAFSITFIKEIVEIAEAQSITFLYLSWTFIIISIGIMMFTFLKSSIASDTLWSIVDDFIISNQLYKDDHILDNKLVDEIKRSINSTFYRNKKILKIFRFVSVTSFICGIIFLALFVSINLSNENKLTEKTIIEKTINSEYN